MSPLLYYYLRLVRQRKLEQLEIWKDLIKQIAENISDSKILDYQDFKDYIFGYESIGSLKLNFPYSFNGIIVSTKHIVIKENLNLKTSKKIIDSIKKEIKKEIKEAKLKDPFNNVPTLERNLLIDIVEISQLKSNKVFIEKVHKLGELIRAKEETINKSGRDNEESLRLAKQSKLLAIIFFIISLGLAIYSLAK